MEIGMRVAFELRMVEGAWRDDMLSLALTCRALRDPALDEVWYKVDELYDLVRQMPHELWDPDQNESEGQGEDEEPEKVNILCSSLSKHASS
jgi:hypothetical protein